MKKDKLIEILLTPVFMVCMVFIYAVHLVMLACGSEHGLADSPEEKRAQDEDDSI